MGRCTSLRSFVSPPPPHCSSPPRRWECSCVLLIPLSTLTTQVRHSHFLFSSILLFLFFLFFSPLLCMTLYWFFFMIVETRGRAQSGTEWREGHLMYDPDTSSIGAYSSGAWSSRYERAPLMAMMTRDHVHAHHQDHPHDYQDHHDDHIQQQQLEHGALALQGIYQYDWGSIWKLNPFFFFFFLFCSTGLWASKYGGHGWEVMSVCLNDSTLSALKMIGMTIHWTYLSFFLFYDSLLGGWRWFDARGSFNDTFNRGPERALRRAELGCGRGRAGRRWRAR